MAAASRTTSTANWDDAHAFLDGATEPEALDGLQDLSAAMGYDFANIRFEDMPDNVGGYTETDYTTDTDGNVTFTGQDIYLNESLLDGGYQQQEDTGLLSALFGQERNNVDFYDETAGLLDTFYHELIHGKQYRDIRESDDAYTEEEIDALQFLHEGQAAYNADGASYRDAQDFYEELVGGEDLEEMMDDYRVDMVYLDDGDEQVYDFVVTDRDDDMSTEEIYEMAADAYGMDVDTEQSREIDYRWMDTDRVMDHILGVQDDIEQGYEDVIAYAGEDALPSGYERIDQAVQAPAPQYQQIGTRAEGSGQYCCG